MNDAIESFYYIMNKYILFIFNNEYVEGVSIGGFAISVLIFSILFNYLLAVPKMGVGGKPKYENREYKEKY